MRYRTAVEDMLCRAAECRQGGAMGGRPVLFVLVFILTLTSCGGSTEASTEGRIRRVERGLLSAQGDPPWRRMQLAQRMAYHNVPGVSIAVIRDYRVEWAKGYGVLQTGRGEPLGYPLS